MEIEEFDGIYAYENNEYCFQESVKEAEVSFRLRLCKKNYHIQVYFMYFSECRHSG